MRFLKFAKQCKFRKEYSFESSKRNCCSYNDENKMTRFMAQCNDYNCKLYSEYQQEGK